MIVDGRVGFLGGINVGNEYDESVSKRDAFRDTHARVEGAAVRELQLTFLEDWHFSTTRVVRDKGMFPPAEAGEHEVAIIVPSRTRSGVGGDRARLLHGDHAGRRTHPTNDAVFRARRAGARRALRGGAAWGARRAHRAAAERLAHRHRGGALVLRSSCCAPGCTSTSTRGWSTRRRWWSTVKHRIVGSANLDNRSFRLNFEVSMIFYDEKALAKLGELFETDKHKCRHTTMKSRARIALPMRLAEASARLLSPLL